MIDQLTKDDIKDIFTNAVYRRGLGYYASPQIHNQSLLDRKRKHQDSFQIRQQELEKKN